MSVAVDLRSDVGTRRRRPPSGSTVYETVITCGSGSALSRGRFGAGYLVPLDSLPEGMELIPLRNCLLRDLISDPSCATRPSSDVATRRVKALFEEVLPVVAGGDDAVGRFRLTDMEHGRTDAESLCEIYSLFFGYSAVAVDLGDDGRFRVTNGSQYVRAARDLGITHLPAWVTLLS